MPQARGVLHVGLRHWYSRHIRCVNDLLSPLDTSCQMLLAMLSDGLLSSIYAINNALTCNSSFGAFHKRLIALDTYMYIQYIYIYTYVYVYTYIYIYMYVCMQD